MQRILLERSFPIEELRLFASPRSAGKRLEWGNTKIVVEDASTANYSGLDIALFSAGKTTSLALAEKVASEGVFPPPFEILRFPLGDRMFIDECVVAFGGAECVHMRS